jgi:SAM-dependent methyltransferase
MMEYQSRKAVAVFLAMGAIRNPETDRVLLEATAVARAGLQCLVIARAVKDLPSEDQFDGVELVRVDSVARLKSTLRSLACKRKAGVWPWRRRAAPRLRSVTGERRLYRSLYDALLGVVRWAIPRCRTGFLGRLVFAAQAVRLALVRFPGRRVLFHGHEYRIGAMILCLGQLSRRFVYLLDHHAYLAHMSPARGAPTRSEQLRKYWDTPRQHPYLDQVLSLVPHDVRSVLDLGCGDGTVLKELRRRGLATCGVDVSPEALERVEGPSLRADVVELDLDQKWDLVLATEFLEHLDESGLRRVVGKMKSWARKYILLSVPNQEQLQIGRCRCVVCGRLFHVNSHHLVFSFRRLQSLFLPQFAPLVVRDTGPKRTVYLRGVLAIRQWVAGVWARSDLAWCPSCGSRQVISAHKERNTLSAWCDRTNERWRARVPTTQGRFLVALYECKKRTRPTDRRGRPIPEKASSTSERGHRRAVPSRG